MKISSLIMIIFEISILLGKIRNIVYNIYVWPFEHYESDTFYMRKGRVICLN